MHPVRFAFECRVRGLLFFTGDWVAVGDASRDPQPSDIFTKSCHWFVTNLRFHQSTRGWWRVETASYLAELAQKLAYANMSSRELAALDFEADGRDISIRIRSTPHPSWYPPLGLILGKIGSICADRGFSLSQLRRIDFAENGIRVELGRRDSGDGKNIDVSLRNNRGIAGVRLQCRRELTGDRWSSIDTLDSLAQSCGLSLPTFINERIGIMARSPCCIAPQLADGASPAWSPAALPAHAELTGQRDDPTTAIKWKIE